MTSPTVSVSLVTYNHEKYVAEAIRSILGQTFTDLELIVVDDGSTDRTPDIVASFTDPRLVSIRQPNGGPSAATNRAMAACRGKYVALMTGDDVSAPHRLAAQLAEYGNGPPRVLFSGCELIDDAGSPLPAAAFDACVFDTAPQSRAAMLRRFFDQGNFINAVSGFTELRLFHELGAYDPSLYLLQDYEMWIRVVKKYPITFLPDPLIRYRIRGDGGNLSAPTPTTFVRLDNEQYLVMRQFFADCPDDLFREAFANMLRRPDLTSSLAAACEQAFLLLNSPRPLLRYIGMERFQELYRSPEASDLLAREFQYPLSAFVGRLTEIDPFNQYLGRTSTVYVDTGSDFNGAEADTVPILYSPRFRFRFDLARYPGVKRLRWDPLEGRLCRVALERAAWRDATGGEHTVDLSQVCANGHQVGPATFEFETIDPMVFLPVAGEVRELTVEGTWAVDDLGASLGRTFNLMVASEAARQRADQRVRELEAELKRDRAELDELRPRAAASPCSATPSAARLLRTSFERLRTAWRPLKSGGVFSS